MPGLSESKLAATILLGKECLPRYMKAINIEADTEQDILERAKKYAEQTKTKICVLQLYYLENQYMENLYKGVLSALTLLAQIDQLAKRTTS